MRTSLSITLGLLTVLMLGGCNKQEAPLLHPDGLTTEHVRVALGEKFMQATYPHYSQQHKCYIKTLKGKEEKRYCVHLAKMVVDKKSDDNIIVHAVETGFQVDKNDEKMDAHVHTGLIKFYKFLRKGDHYDVIAQSDDVEAGSFGRAPSHIKIHKLGEKIGLGWVAADGDTHNGHLAHWVHIYAPFGKKIKPVANILTVYSSKGACTNPKACDYAQIVSRITFMPNQKKVLYDLRVDVVGIDIVKGKKNNIHKTLTVKFDPKAAVYQTAAVDKIFKGRDY